MKKIVIFSLLLVLCPWVPGITSPDHRVLRVRDGQIVSFSDMIRDLRTVSVVFVGEVHDSPRHHLVQLNVIRAFHEAEQPVAIGLEMFRKDSQGKLDSWVAGKLSVEEFKPAFLDNWRLPWPLYQDVFLYAREHELALVGLNISEGISKKIARKGFASLTEKERKELPPGISCNVDPTYMEFIRRAYAGHSGHGPKFVNFCEAQMVWDKAMAWNLTGYLKKNPASKMIILAGVGHAWKRGIPEQLEPGLTYRVVLPAVADQIDRHRVSTKDADYVVLE
jgi:uncharacterized iron-regulated protein